jgi:hypothetical protein
MVCVSYPRTSARGVPSVRWESAVHFHHTAGSGAARGWSTKGRGETPSEDARGGTFGMSPCAKHGRMSGGLAESRAYRMWSHAVLCCAARHKTGFKRWRLVRGCGIGHPV